MSNEFNTNISADAKFYRLKPGATRPTTATEELPVGTEEFGYTAIEGWNWAQSQTIEPVKAHQKKKVLRNKITDEAKSAAVTFLEDKKLVRETYHNGTEDANGRMIMKSGVVQQGTYVIDSTDDGVGYEKDVRFIFDATVTANGDLTFSPEAETTYPVMFNIIGEPIRISKTRYTDGTTPPVEEEPPVGGDTYPTVGGLSYIFSAGDNSLTAEWFPLTLTGGATIEKFDISLQPLSGGTSLLTGVAQPNANTYTFTDVVPDANYQLVISYTVLPYDGGQPHGSANTPVSTATA
jgi:hypothetical protein